MDELEDTARLLDVWGTYVEQGGALDVIGSTLANWSNSARDASAAAAVRRSCMLY